MYPKFAGGQDAGDTGLPIDIFAGDTPAFVSQDFSLTAPAGGYAQYTPLTRATNGTWSAWAAGQPVHGVVMYPVAAGTRRIAIATEAMFNIDAIAWPAGTTEAQALAAQQSNVRYRKLLYSDRRNGAEPTLVGPGHHAGPSA